MSEHGDQRRTLYSIHRKTLHIWIIPAIYVPHEQPCLPLPVPPEHLLRPISPLDCIMRVMGNHVMEGHTSSAQPKILSQPVAGHKGSCSAD